MKERRAQEREESPWYKNEEIDSGQQPLFGIRRASVPRETKWTALEITGVHNITSSIFQHNFITELYLSNNQLAKLPSEIKNLRMLHIIDISHNRFTSLPEELVEAQRLTHIYAQNNQITHVETYFINLFNIEVLDLQNNPLIEVQKTIFNDHGGAQLLVMLRDVYYSECDIKYTETSLREIFFVGMEPYAVDNVSIVSYNILRSATQSKTVHGYVPHWVFDFSYRSSVIFQELAELRADIVCLQELEIKNYKLFCDELRMRCDYENQFAPKGRAYNMRDYERQFVDGCATFYKLTRFRLLRKEVVRFNQAISSRPALSGIAIVIDRNVTRDNVALILVLESITTGEILIVANCHMYWEDSYRDVKLMQTIVLIEEIEKLREVYKYASVFVAGDFNSTAETGVYELLHYRHLRDNHVDFAGYNYGPYKYSGFKHDLQLTHAYSQFETTFFTHYTSSFKGMIDYIWYTTDRVTCTAVLGPVRDEYVSKYIGFPTTHYPSDHIILYAEFKIRQLYENIKNK